MNHLMQQQILSVKVKEEEVKRWFEHVIGASFFFKEKTFLYNFSFDIIHHLFHNKLLLKCINTYLFFAVYNL